jgi:hypothetical protein
MGTYAIDRLYYVMDYSSNYYKVDEKGQLVVAGTDEDATVFSFAEANKRIGAGPKSRFYFMTPVDEDDIDNLSNDESDVVYESSDDVSAVTRELIESENNETIEKSISEYELSSINWKEYLTQFTCIVSELGEYKKTLVKSLSEVDQKICDILHYIELCETSDEDSADIIELLRVCRENRRVIKDEILRVDTFQRNFGTTTNVTKAKEVLKALKGLETRKYKPRKFFELFDGNVICVQRDTEKRTTKIESFTNAEDSFFNDKEEEMQMEYVRKETIFDGKENDWIAFASMQAEFYKNANQYIVNLQIDIDNIDEEIADLMEEMEVSNCNVTQGYKLFKRMKDLRLKRREKENELESLYILTDHFNMGRMAEECKRKYEELDTYLFGSRQDDPDEGYEDENIDNGDKAIIGLAG